MSEIPKPVKSIHRFFLRPRHLRHRINFEKLHPVPGIFTR